MIKVPGTAALLVFLSVGVSWSAVFEGLNPYSAQMHVHSLSSHNATNGTIFATMDNQLKVHWEAGIDVLWLSEHNTLFQNLPAPVYAFSDAYLDENGYIRDKKFDKKTFRLFKTVKRGRYTNISIEDGLNLVVLPNKAKYQQCILIKSNTPRGHMWVRPMSYKPILQAQIDFHPKEEVVFDFVVNLCHHYYSDGYPYQHRIIYRIANISSVERRLYDHHTILVQMPYRADGKYAFDLYDAAVLLEDGEDNTFSNVEFNLYSNSSEGTRVNLKELRLVCEGNAGNNNVGSMHQLLGKNTKYSIAKYLGVEYSAWNVEGTKKHHVNGFVPGILPIEMADPGETNATLGKWVELVHATGGLVSINHPFAPPSGYTTTEELLGDLLLHDAYGADILEVGYLQRGVHDLREHTALWDALTSRGIFLVGNGTSDVHGTAVYSDSRHPFATWIWSEDHSPEALLRNLKAGRAYFGNILLWDGKLAFKVGNHSMGEVAITAEDSLPLEVELDPFPDDFDLYLVQRRMAGEKSLGDVEYLHERTLLDRNDLPWIDTSGNSFVRLEVYRRSGQRYPEGEPVILTNNIVILKPEDQGFGRWSSTCGPRADAP